MTWVGGNIRYWLVEGPSESDPLAQNILAYVEKAWTPTSQEKFILRVYAGFETGFSTLEAAKLAAELVCS